MSPAPSPPHEARAPNAPPAPPPPTGGDTKDDTPWAAHAPDTTTPRRSTPSAPPTPAPRAPSGRVEAEPELEKRLREIEAELRRLRPAAGRPQD